MKNPGLKKLLVIGPALASLTVFAGCEERQDNETVEQMSETVQETGQLVAEKSSDAWDKLQSATYDERAEIQSFLSDSADKVQGEVSSLMSTAGNKSSAAWNTAKSNYMDAQDDFAEKLSELGNATEDNWDQAKSNASEAWQNLEESISELKDSLK